jgi:predicted metal-dependent HD superfamily phosphohydrolase
VGHLDECFAKLDEIRPLAEHPAEVDVALWFHDAIYDPRRGDNEAQIRDEYGFVPQADYRRSRTAILERVLSRPTIFSTKAFIERYEQQARANLACSLAKR